MLEQLLSLDQAVFEWIHRHGRHEILDFILPIWRNKLTWIPLYFVLLILLYRSFPLRSFIILLIGIALTILISDTLSSQIIKKSVERPRPCHLLSKAEDIKLLIPCGSGYSFTSSHATNHSALAAFLFLTLGVFYRRFKWFWIAWALLIGFAQVYVGVHYLGDVIVGALLGIGIGWSMAKLTLHLGKIATKKPMERIATNTL